MLIGDRVEELSAEVHKVYCEYYKDKHGQEYWTKGDYSKLPDDTKEADRYFVRWHLNKLKEDSNASKPTNTT